jgi:Doubled CXXCH motif (Paired_CXXCH_1)/Cytochrome c554 and c-prime
VPDHRRFFWHGLFAVAVVVTGGALTFGSYRYFQRRIQPPENRPIQSSVGNYVTSNTCRACHLDNYASWHASFHRTMTQVATTATILGVDHPVELSFDGRDYKLERRGEKVVVRTRSSGNDYGPPREVVLLTGSHNLQILWIETSNGRTLEQLPFAYIIAEKMWAPVTQTFLMPPDTKEYYSIGAWNGACMDCHVTQGQSRFVSGNTWDTRVAEFGIACEACHSEGRQHIARNRNPLRRFVTHLTTGSDATITNPTRLSAAASSLDCAQCHSIWAFNNMTDKIDFNRQGSVYRPGHGDLGQRFVVQPNTSDHSDQKEFIRQTEPEFFANRFWGDGMIRVTGREFNGLQASPCFRGGKFSCVSCHEMHPNIGQQVSLSKWANGAQLKPKMDSDEACFQCHKNFAMDISAHTHHSTTSPGSRCYNCHMPHTTFGLLRGIRSHQVSSPSVHESTEYHRPNACNLCHLNQTLAWTANKLHAWYEQPLPELSREDESIASGVQWLIQGDAGQRALIAWGMGWPPAQQASGRHWLYPYLIYTLNDPYAAVRFDAWKSLQTLPGFSDFSFNYTADALSIREASARAYTKWVRELRGPNPVFEPQTVLESRGAFQDDVMRRLEGARDNRRIFLAE